MSDRLQLFVYSSFGFYVIHSLSLSSEFRISYTVVCQISYHSHSHGYLLIGLVVASFQKASITFLYSANFVSLLLICSCKWSLFFAQTSCISLCSSNFFLSSLCCLTFFKYFSLTRNKLCQIHGSNVCSQYLHSFMLPSAFITNWKSKKSTSMSCNKKLGFTVKMSPPLDFGDLKCCLSLCKIKRIKLFLVLATYSLQQSDFYSARLSLFSFV